MATDCDDIDVYPGDVIRLMRSYLEQKTQAIHWVAGSTALVIAILVNQHNGPRLQAVVMPHGSTRFYTLTQDYLARHCRKLPSWWDEV